MARPEFKPTKKMRKTVEILTGLGVKTEDVAKVIGVAPKTLRKHFRLELDLGMIDANAKVVESLFEMATTGKNAAAAIFWAKTRCGFREKGSGTAAEESRAPQIVLKIDGDVRE